MLPLIGYNYAAKKFKRTEDRSASDASSHCHLRFCVVIYEILRRDHIAVYQKRGNGEIRGSLPAQDGAWVMPLMSLCYPLIIKFQAMYKSKKNDNGFDSPSQGSSRYSALFHDGCTVSAVRLHVGSADC